MGVSYDPTGRFKSTRQENLFFKNIQIFADAGLLECIDICPTNNNIEYYINHTNILKRLDLYGCGINFSYYVSDCTKDKQRLIPDPDLLYKLFEIILINNFKNYNTVNMFTSSIYNYGETIDRRYCDGHNALFYYDGKFGNCTMLPLLGSSSWQKLGHTCTEEYPVRFIKKLSLNGESDLGCFKCKYNNVCPRPCWIMNSTKDSKCFCKKVYDYIITHFEEYKPIQ